MKFLLFDFSYRTVPFTDTDINMYLGCPSCHTLGKQHFVQHFHLPLEYFALITKLPWYHTILYCSVLYSSKDSFLFHGLFFGGEGWGVPDPIFLYHKSCCQIRLPWEFHEHEQLHFINDDDDLFLFQPIHLLHVLF